MDLLTRQEALIVFPEYFLGFFQWFHLFRMTSKSSLIGWRLFGDCAVESFEYNGHKIVALGAFDLLEGLNVFLLGAVHDGKNLGHEVRFIS